MNKGIDIHSFTLEEKRRTRNKQYDIFSSMKCTHWYNI